MRESRRPTSTWRRPRGWAWSPGTASSSRTPSTGWVGRPGNGDDVCIRWASAQIYANGRPEFKYPSVRSIHTTYQTTTYTHQVQSGRAAGMQVVAVPDPRLDGSPFLEHAHMVRGVTG